MLDRQRFIDDMRALAAKRTRFLHQGRSENGVDCINLPAYAIEKQGIALPFDFGPYHRYVDSVRLLSTMRQWLTEIKPSEAAASDVYVFRIRGHTQHVAVRINDEDPPMMVQALKEGVREIPLDDQWQSRIVTVFRIPDEF